LLEKHQAEVLVSRPWDERRLSYPVGNQKKGLYYLTYFSTEGKNLAEIERDCALNDMILRQLVIRLPEKLVETMLAVAKGEHAVALQSMHEEPAEEGTPAEAPAGGEAGAPKPRRPRAEKVADKS
jgi:small subunit ribosomal protein S6